MPLFWLSVLYLVTTDAHFITDENMLSPIFDYNLYEEVLNAKLCQKQIRFMVLNNSILLSRFLDAGIRVPRGIFVGNSVDYGNYYQCLEINEPHDGSRITGKYCIVHVPLYQDLIMPGFSGTVESVDVNILKLGPVPNSLMEKYYAFIKAYRALSIATSDHRDNALSGTVFRLAVCVPRPCTIKEAVSALLFNVSSIGFQYGEEFCRLPNDKPWVLADSVAVLFLSMIAILTLLSTSYELFYIFVLKRDANGANIHFRAFSVYTNTQRLMSFPQNADTLECLDGIRTITTAWVIFSHVFSSLSFLQNPYEEWAWMLSAGGLWITAAPVTVDTFFVMTGILLVYTTAKKMDGMTLVRRLHLFYLNRMLRMLPLLATAVILDASLFHKIADGPYWTPVATNAERCRIFWWTTLLHLQNYLNPRKMCVPHSWYVALDIQLHILSPVLLFWLLNGRQQTAWSAVVATLAVAMGASAIYNCAMELPSHTFSPSRDSQLFDYMTKYYFHVMSRITPFLVGMAFGYLLHLWRRRIVIMNKIVAVCLWALTFLVMGFTLYMLYRVKQLNWNNQAVDTALNILMRPAWAAAVGWMVLACVHGYGGPINWFLSLPMWRLPGRISYGMYLFHYPIMFVVNGTAVSSPYFSIPNYLFQCLAHMAISFVASFVLTVTIDAPFTIIFRRLLDRGMTQTKWKRVEQLEAHELAPRTDFH